MSGWKKLTSLGGHPVWVNLDNSCIVREPVDLERQAGAVAMVHTLDGTQVRVRETVAQIMEG